MAVMLEKRKLKPHAPKTVVYSCSGCSSAAQMANDVALRLDRSGIAEMSCISGVGGDVPALVRIARSADRIVALDGCPLQCARACLARHGLAPTKHFDLSRMGIRKRLHVDFDRSEADRVYGVVAESIAAALA